MGPIQVFVHVFESRNQPLLNPPNTALKSGSLKGVDQKKLYSTCQRHCLLEMYEKEYFVWKRYYRCVDPVN